MKGTDLQKRLIEIGSLVKMYASKTYINLEDTFSIVKELERYAKDKMLFVSGEKNDQFVISVYGGDKKLIGTFIGVRDFNDLGAIRKILEYFLDENKEVINMIIEELNALKDYGGAAIIISDGISERELKIYAFPPLGLDILKDMIYLYPKFPIPTRALITKAFNYLFSNGTDLLKGLTYLFVAVGSGYSSLLNEINGIGWIQKGNGMDWNSVN